MKLGVDISTYLEELEHGAVYYQGSNVVDPLDLLRERGVDSVRLRLWNDPQSEDGTSYLGGGCSLDVVRRTAALVMAKGFDLMLDFHYSDFWVDPGKQMIPKAWRGKTLGEMADAVYAYTRDTLLSLRADSILPSYVQIGNEITNGILWPVGRLGEESDSVRSNYDSLCALLKAGVRACREVAPSAKIVLHLERSHDQAVYQEFFTQMQAHGVDFDVIGVSYYPFWHGTFEQFFANMDACKVFGKEQMVVEMGYGFTLKPYVLHGKDTRLVVTGDLVDRLPMAERYPFTPRGQADFVRDFLALAFEHGLSGVYYWEPLWIPGEGICWASPEGQDYIGESGKSTANEWANQCLFDYEGRALPALSAFTNK